MFTITLHKGFRITFANGLTVSVQWGPGNYCEGYPSLDLHAHDKPKQADTWENATAECAVWDAAGDWLRPVLAQGLGRGELGDDVAGWCSPDEVARLIAFVASLDPPRKELTP